MESVHNFPLFVFTWHSWWGKSRIPNEQNITHARRNFGWLAASFTVFPPHGLVLSKRAWNRDDICYETWNVCYFLNIILWLACFVSNVFPNHVHRWMNQQRNSCHISMKWLVQGNFNMWFWADNAGVSADLPCPGAGWWRKATWRRMWPLWDSKSLVASYPDPGESVRVRKSDV